MSGHGSRILVSHLSDDILDMREESHKDLNLNTKVRTVRSLGRRRASYVSTHCRSEGGLLRKGVLYTSKKGLWVSRMYLGKKSKGASEGSESKEAV